jgi:predicted GNAT family acetyltransferase
MVGSAPGVRDNAIKHWVGWLMRWVGWFLARAVAVMDIHETFVPESHRGRDLGATLAHAAFTLAASRGLASPWVMQSPLDHPVQLYIYRRASLVKYTGRCTNEFAALPRPGWAVRPSCSYISDSFLPRSRASGRKVSVYRQYPVIKYKTRTRDNSEALIVRGADYNVDHLNV